MDMGLTQVRSGPSAKARNSFQKTKMIKEFYEKNNDGIKFAF